jgi:mono/diheme cytochrome c family protein
MGTKKLVLGSLAVMAILGSSVTTADQTNKATERGRYLVTVGGCNDCHTVGYPQRGGNVPESDWLTGSPVGFSGPWGTTYPANLRLSLQNMDEDQWLKYARAERRPPMPWFNLAKMQDKDLKAMYHYIRSLGAKGEPAPQYAPPGQAVNTPYIDFVPKNLPQQAKGE